MSDDGASNVTQVLKAFHRFLQIYENPSWAKSVTTEEIKSAFKLGKFIESTVANFQEKEFSKRFFHLLELWLIDNNCHKFYTEFFFVEANNRLLEKLFKFPNIKESTLDIGVRIYTSMYPKERFQECIENLILKTNSNKAIADFVKACVTDSCSVEYSIILNKWSDYCKIGMKDQLKSEIDSYLSLYNVEENLPRLIGMLGSKKSILVDNSGNEVILECLLNKMTDRSLLSKKFWLVLFQKLDMKDVTSTCKNYPTFFQSLFNFIEYIGGMMTKDQSELAEWKSDPSVSFCHEISYFELVVFLKSLSCESDLNIDVLNRLEKAKEFSNSDLWTQIISDIFD
ncbi:uncharacterized protein LOC126744436 isoform X1 [Anthonomus grandis grandis]|uniref:uncharacterized protein LOC126744436 isoform X1 n=1 Tax=Anthonomus grandis grandis TaxID=2921223 RepID=UPI0021653ED5|nr:uncharacterized protein LOC126744436 isoform X1 [Anthonomus grandis grandis]